MADTRRGYTSLPQDDEHEGPLEKVSTPAPAESQIYHRLIRWSTAIIILCTLVDGLLFLYLALHYTARAPPPPVAAVPDSLAYRSTYINFDRLYRDPNSTVKSSAHGPIINLARAFAQVSAAEPDTVFPQWPDSWPTVNGIVPIGDRRLLVTPEISTIVQFRVLDYGMEQCVLTLSVPPTNDTSTATVSGPHGEPTAALDVYAVDAPHKLDFQRLSWRTRPRRTRHVGTLLAAPGRTHALLPGFACPAATYQSFEIACAQCRRVDVTGVERQVMGLYISQHQTI